MLNLTKEQGRELRLRSLKAAMEMLFAPAQELGQVPTGFGLVSYGWFQPPDRERQYVALLSDSRYECWDETLGTTYDQPWCKIHLGVDEEILKEFVTSFVDEMETNPPEELVDVTFGLTAVFKLKEEYRNVKKQGENPPE